MLFKRKSYLLIIISSLLVLAGCGGTKLAGTNDAVNASDAGGKGKYTMIFAHDHTTTSPFQTSAERFKKLVEERSEGRMEVQIYPSMQLGTSREMIEGLQLGSIQMVNLPTAGFTGFDNRFTLVDMPYLFPDEDTLWEVLDNEIGRELLDGLESQGFKGLSFYAEGFKAMTNNRLIRRPEDLKGLRIRTMNSPVIMDQYKAWGANPVPIDFGEVYNSLQQGVVEGQENPLLSIHDMKFYEVQDYMIMSEHAYLSYVNVMNKAWFDSLPEDLKKIVWDTGLEVAQEHKALMKKMNETYFKDIQSSGIKIIELTPEEKEAFRQASLPVYDEYRTKIGDLLDRTIERIGEIQNQ